MLEAPPGQPLVRMIPTGRGGVKARPDRKSRTGSFRFGVFSGRFVLRLALTPGRLPFGGEFQQEAVEAAQPVLGVGRGLEVDGDRAEPGVTSALCPGCRGLPGFFQYSPLFLESRSHRWWPWPYLTSA